MNKNTEKSNRYNKKNTKQINIRLNKKTDEDIILKLERVGNKQGYIKELIRKDIDYFRISYLSLRE